MKRLFPISVTLLLAGVALVIAATRFQVPPYEYWRESLVIGLVDAILARLILATHPRHRIGWLFALFGLAAGLQLMAGAYATWASPAAADVSGRAMSAWLANSLRQPSVLSFIFLVMLFPTGLLLGRRWRYVAVPAVVGLVLFTMGLALGAGPLEDFPDIENPFGLIAPTVLLQISNVLLIVFLLGGGLASLVVRYLRSRGLERQQLKWFVYSVAVMVGGLTLLSLLLPIQMEGPLGFYAWLLLPLSVEAAIAFAIMRYRLYDIDLVINRTLVYGSLTLLLGAVYVAGVVLVPRLLPFTQDNDLVVAGTTLAVAALFSPLRRRLQAFVDRRFYRSRYDAQRTVEAFSARLREEVDLESLRADLAGVVSNALQPASVSVWLRPPQGARG